MQDFALLFESLDRTTSLLAKQAALVRYFRAVSAEDGAWATALLSGRRPKKPLTTSLIIAALIRYLQIPQWLYDETKELVGDGGETVALLIDTLRQKQATASSDVTLQQWMEVRLPALAALSDEERMLQLAEWWSALAPREIFLLQKLIAGGFRVGASEALVAKALAEVAGLPLAVITQRLTGKWAPTAAFFASLIAPAEGEQQLDPAQPYPFALAYPLDRELSELGPVSDWISEWKWDGIRAQIVRRAGEVHIWSRGEELVTGAFPELAAAALAQLSDGTVVDGEILAFAADAEASELKPQPFAALQKRLGRKKVSAAVQKAGPVRFFAYDLLETAGTDLRSEAFSQRRTQLAQIFAGTSLPFGLSPTVAASSWDDLVQARTKARELGVEGLMLKHNAAPYRAGRRKGDWWKWKVEPLVVDAVLIYAQAGAGRRANLFTDYSFAVWDGDLLVTVAKAYSGLDQKEITELDRWIRAHTREKFGPVRSVIPELVFELGFEGIQASGRHKSGVALRFPRILRWRRDKPALEADHLTTLKAMLDGPR